jgi:hypothetical protein
MEPNNTNISQIEIKSLRNIRFAYELLLLRVPSISKLDYKTQSQLLNLEFEGVNCTERDISVINDSTLEEDIKDLEINMSNLGLYGK